MVDKIQPYRIHKALEKQIKTNIVVYQTKVTKACPKATFIKNVAIGPIL